MDYWTTGLAPLRKLPTASSLKLCDVPPHKIVDGPPDLLPPQGWTCVQYSTGAKTFEGWINNSYLEAYTARLPHGCVDIQHQTADPHDLAQYMIWKKVRQVNQCGPICAAHILHVGLEEILVNWEAKVPNVFKRIFSRGVATGTDIGDLQQIFEMYALRSESLSAVLKDPVRGTPFATPRRMEALVETSDVIVGVKISTATGDLKSGGALHWVVLEAVYPDEIDNGFVMIFNPATNSLQNYSWREFKASMGVPYGLIVPH